MVYEVYAVHDVKIGAFAPPFLMRTRGEAVRAFHSSVVNGDGPLKHNREDYSLHFLGHWDDNSGEYSGKGQFVMTAAEV